jgi:hypothetical protein
MTLERKDNDGDYEPGNCLWASDTEQRRNKRTNHLIEFDGRLQALVDWASEIGISEHTLSKRLRRQGWTIEQALTMPELGNGAGLIWITDGAHRRRILPDTPIPAGWWQGLPAAGRRIWITDGKLRRRIRPDAPIPMGWRRGLLA